MLVIANMLPATTLVPLPNFDKAIQIDPNYVKAYNNRGMAKDVAER